MRKRLQETAVIRELPAARCQKGVHSRLVNHRRLLVALALNRPILAFVGFADDVNSGIGPSKRLTEGELFPKPDVGKKTLVGRVSFKKSLNQPLKTLTTRTVVRGLRSVLLKEEGKTHVVSFKFSVVKVNALRTALSV